MERWHRDLTTPRTGLEAMRVVAGQNANGYSATVQPTHSALAVLARMCCTYCSYTCIPPFRHQACRSSRSRPVSVPIKQGDAPEARARLLHLGSSRQYCTAWPVQVLHARASWSLVPPLVTRLYFPTTSPHFRPIGDVLALTRWHQSRLPAYAVHCRGRVAMADQAAAVAANSDALPPDEIEALLNVFAIGDGDLANDVASEALTDLRSKYQAEGGDIEDLAYQLGAAKEADLEGRQDGSRAEHYDELVRYIGDLERATDALAQEVEMEEAESMQERPLLDSPFVPGVVGDDLHPAVHIALIPCSLVRHVKAGRWVGADLALCRVPTKVSRAIAVRRRGGDFSVVGGAAVGSCPVLLVKYTNSLMSRCMLIVAVRATSNLAGWLSDACIRLVTLPPQWGLPEAARVHAGFSAVARSLEGPLFKQIYAQLDANAGTYPTGPQMEVVFAGHSLGGAVATLLAARGDSRIPNATLVTFGCPRVGNAALQAAVRERTEHSRLFTSGDPLPGMPLWWWNTPYSPAEAQHHWSLHAPETEDAEASTILNEAGPDERTGRTNLQILPEMFRGTRRDHKMDVYLQRMVAFYAQLRRVGNM